jgi:hypothetical protein
MTRAELADAVVKLGRRTDRREIIRYEESAHCVGKRCDPGACAARVGWPPTPPVLSRRQA